MKSEFIFVILISLLGVIPAEAGSDAAAESSRQGVELLKQGQFDKAVAPLLKAVELNPDDAEVRLNLAYAYDHERRIDEAISEYQKVIELNPRHSIVHNNLGVLYSKKGLYDEAIREFETVLEIDPRSATGPKNLETAKKNRAAIQEQQQQVADAVKEVAAQPENSLSAYKLARLYAFYGKKDQALEWLAKALKMGFHDMAFLKKDTALDSLRDDPDYVWLLRGR